ncbi:MAG: signal recognition particle-docking protein FtsY [Candidatus Micrarchaeia archaeon]|jgi:fused signal recognition particle receptor
MFGLLKNKLASFIKGLSGKEEKKEAEALPVEEPKSVVIEEKKEATKIEKKEGPKPVEKKAAEEKKPEKKAEPKTEAKPKMEKKPAPAPKIIEKKSEPKPAEITHAPKPEMKQAEPEPVIAPQKIVEAPKKEEPKKSIIDVLFRKPTPKPAGAPMPKPVEVQKPSIQTEKPISQPKSAEALQPKPAEAPQPSPQPKLSEMKRQPEAQKMAVQPSAHHKPPAHPLPETPSQAERDFSQLERRATSSSDKREIAPKIGIATTLKSIFSSEITIGEAEVSDLLSELELSLLEADVAYDVSLDVSAQLRARLVGMKVPKGKVEERTREAIQGVLASVMTSDRKFDMVARVRTLEKPAKILFVGPNGAGKTTTMAKVAHMLLAGGMTVVFSASDTFRAAAIEQTEVHAGRLGIKVVKSKYGADPASVAFDAVNFARTHNIDVVLIDSAGRQDTNANLLDELKKISRVAKPDIKIYIGESIGGNSLIDQVRAFDEAIGMDGAILTKIDCDAKGGTALSLTKSTGIPVLYLGVGQAYTDLIPFEPEKIAQEIMS